jgi:hypothetical protein
MNPIRTSRIAPVVAEMRFRGVLEGAYLLRLLLEKKSNLATRTAMANLFGSWWGAATQERQYFELLSTYVLRHHQAEYFAYLKNERIKYKSNDLRAARAHLIRYLNDVQNLGGMSDVVNDLTPLQSAAVSGPSHATVIPNYLYPVSAPGWGTPDRLP